MNQQKKILFMFAPLVIGIAGVLFAIQDLKHPTVSSDQCTVLGTGPNMARYINGHNVLYNHGAASIYDVGFQCQKMGVVVLNDQESFKRSLAEGDAATITHKTFQFMPEIWRVEVKTPLSAEEKSEYEGKTVAYPPIDVRAVRD